MRILVLGGTQFVGRHLVEALVGGGHVVTVFNRGVTADALPLSVERLVGIVTWERRELRRWRGGRGTRAWT